MRFGFSEDQTLFQQTLRELLENECSHEALAAAWETPDGRVPGLWAKLAEMGVLGLTVPDEQGGLGLNEIDLALLLEEAGRAGCPEPLAENIAVAAPLLAEVGGATADEFLPKLAEGEARIALSLEPDPYVADAEGADLLLAQRGDEIHALRPSDVKLTPKTSVDGARRLFALEFSPSAETRIAGGSDGAALIARAFDRAAWAAAAQLAGLGHSLVEMTVEYAKGRVQFGQPIGAFQAVKHHLANAKTKLEFARPPVYYAAHSLATGADTQSLDVSTAKTLAGEAAYQCHRTALQCHGAIAYTYEYHAHMWMKRVLVLRRTHGDARFHKRRAARQLLG